MYMKLTTDQVAQRELAARTQRKLKIEHLRNGCGAPPCATCQAYDFAIQALQSVIADRGVQS